MLLALALAACGDAVANPTDSGSTSGTAPTVTSGSSEGAEASGEPVTTGARDPVTTGVLDDTTGAPSGDATTGDHTASHATTGDANTGEVTTGEVTTGEVTTGDATTGDPPPPVCATDGRTGGALKWSLEAEELPGLPRFVTATPSADSVTVGVIELNDVDQDIYVAVHDRKGGLRWMDIYAGVHGLEDQPSAVAVDAAGFIHVLLVETLTKAWGENWAHTDARLVLLRYAPDGTHVWRWEQPHDPAPPNKSYVPTGALGLVGEEIHVLVGTFNGPRTLLRLDRFGNLLSEIPIAVPEGVMLHKLQAPAFGPGGVLHLTSTVEPNGTNHVWVGRFAADGSLVWSDAFASKAGRPEGITVNEHGEIFLVWENFVMPGVIERRLRRYLADGSVAWAELLPFSDGGSDFSRIAVHCDQTPLLVGAVTQPADQWVNPRDLWAARYSLEGAPLWTAVHAFGPPYGYGGGQDIAGAPDGNVLVIGSYQFKNGYLPWLGRFGG